MARSQKAKENLKRTNYISDKGVMIDEITLLYYKVCIDNSHILNIIVNV
jgi:hypothetical protein